MAEGEDAFKRALKLLNNKGSLSSADARLKASIEQSIEDARGTTRVVKGVQVDQTQMPWTLANQVLKLNFDPSDRATWYSSAWVIAAAHSVGAVLVPGRRCADLLSGVCWRMPTAICVTARWNRVHGHDGRKYGVPPHSPALTHFKALESITNGLISDSRSFFIDRPDFFECYKAQGLPHTFVVASLPFDRSSSRP